MKKIIVVLVLSLSLILTGCTTEDIKCGAGTVVQDGQCVAQSEVEEPVINCDFDEELINGKCEKKEEEPLQCPQGQKEENGVCVEDIIECLPGYELQGNECVLIIIDIPEWFTGWRLLSEPVGDKQLSDYDFTDTGFSVNVGFNQRTGIKMDKQTFEAGYAYEVTFDYSSDVDGQTLFVELQAHSGSFFINPSTILSTENQTFSQTLVMYPDGHSTNDGWIVLEILPSGNPGTVSISNIEVIRTALPVCEEHEKNEGLECVPDNNGFIPNGTPTAWFDGWEILTGPAGDKEIKDYNFTETGFTAYLDHGERTGIQLMNYVFESGYTYELKFNYTAGEAGRMVWVQMEALGGYGFTNTDTWTISGTGTFSQTLEIPSTYTPVEPGWIKLELTPGGQDNITIDNIEIIKTPIE